MDKRLKRQWYFDREDILSVEIKSVDKKTHNYECVVNGKVKLKCQYSFTALAFVEVCIDQMKEQRRNKL